MNIKWIYAVLIGYLFGCINAAYILAKGKGFDIRQRGTGNPGASNIVVNLGWKYGIITGLFDILKSFAAAALCTHLFPEVPGIRAFASAGAILGHILPFYMGFKGGKGFASYVGAMAAIDWKMALIVLALLVVITLVTGYIAAGTLVTLILFPIAVWLDTKDVYSTAVLAVIGLIIAFRHRDNFRNIMKGTESKIHQYLPGKKEH